MALGFPFNRTIRVFDEEFQALQDKFNRSLIDQFNQLYGMRDNIAGWQELCRITGTRNPPPTIGECQAIMKETHVNLVDLTEWIGDKDSEFVTVFADVESLRDYSFDNNKVFPRRELHAGDVLRFFLRKLSAHGGVGSGQRAGKKRVRTKRQTGSRR
ncbi:hypothetical protein BJ165DRAFT_1612323 [Panaeolus papilionaceus]|nr:hypothetical protein BJ165DRAFT_1612323 [Panaeolus papilionaceus]